MYIPVVTDDSADVVGGSDQGDRAVGAVSDGTGADPHAAVLRRETDQPPPTVSEWRLQALLERRADELVEFGDEDR